MGKITSICHRKLGSLLPRWMSRATAPRPDGEAGLNRRGAMDSATPAEPDAFTSIATRRQPVRASRRNLAEAANSRSTRPPRPLRVLQVVDPFAPASGIGRIVISGRMADVCAELDRLAALESRRSCA